LLGDAAATASAALLVRLLLVQLRESPNTGRDGMTTHKEHGVGCRLEGPAKACRVRTKGWMPCGTFAASPSKVRPIQYPFPRRPWSAFLNSWRDRRPARLAHNETPTSRPGTELQKCQPLAMLARTARRRMTRVVARVPNGGGPATRPALRIRLHDRQLPSVRGRSTFRCWCCYYFSVPCNSFFESIRCK
jgi:hypothetical protein